MGSLDDATAVVTAPLDPPSAAGAGPTGAPGISDLAERCIWSVVWLGVVSGGFQLWGSWSAWSFGGLASPLLVLIGIGGLVAVWLVASPRSPVMQVGALAMVVASMVSNQGFGIHTRRFYSTDSAAFNQAAAHFLIHGVDPYAVSLGSTAAKLLKAPAQFWTYTVTGGHVDHLSYPAGSVLIQMPALLLGFHHEIVDWLDLFAWIVTLVLIFAFLPASVRWIAALLALAPAFSGVFNAGTTDAAFLPFLVLAVWRWDRFGLGRGAGVARWMGPVALGLACSIKQTPWFCIPFIVIGLVIEARMSDRRPLRVAAPYLAIVIGVFAAVNLPFVIWSPTAWARGTFLPFVEPLIADGQGLVTLALHGIAHGVSMPLLTLAGALVLIAEMAAMVIWYPAMKRIWMLLLPLAFFVATRSLSTYLADLYPAAIVAVVSVAPAPRALFARTTGRLRLPAGLAALVPACAAVGVCVLAFWSPPLQLSVRSVDTSDAATSLDAVTVAVHNTTGRTVTPHFMVTVGSGHPNGFWSPAGGGPVVLGPHGSETVTLQPNSPPSTPSHGSEWLVEAYTTSPDALSTTPLMYWSLGHH